MSITLIVTLVFAPSLFWFGYFYYHDRFKPEPPILTALSYLLGFFSGWLCLQSYESFFSRYKIPLGDSGLVGMNLSFLLYCILVVGLVEELFKFVPFWVMTRFSDFNEEIDGIFYASAVALGFASYENIHYLPQLTGFVLVGRAFASPLSHTIFASVWGYLVGRKRVHGQRIWPAAVIGVGLASVSHGLFDFLTFSPVWRLLGALMLLVLWLWRIKTSEMIAAKGVVKVRDPFFRK